MKCSHLLWWRRHDGDAPSRPFYILSRLPRLFNCPPPPRHGRSPGGAAKSRKEAQTEENKKWNDEMIIYHIILMSERRLVSGAFYAVRTLRRAEGDVPSEKMKRGEILQQCGSRAASCVREDDLLQIPVKETGCWCCRPAGSLMDYLACWRVAMKLKASSKLKKKKKKFPFQTLNQPKVTRHRFRFFCHLALQLPLLVFHHCFHIWGYQVWTE